MRPPEILNALPPLGVAQRALLQQYTLHLAVNAREATLADGKYLCGISDMERWLKELAAEIQPRIPFRTPSREEQPRFESAGAGDRGKS